MKNALLLATLSSILMACTSGSECDEAVDKLESCDIRVDVVTGTCDETSACESTCIIEATCDELRATFTRGQQNAYTDCDDACN